MDASSTATSRSTYRTALVFWAAALVMWWTGSLLLFFRNPERAGLASVFTAGTFIFFMCGPGSVIFKNKKASTGFFLLGLLTILALVPLFIVMRPNWTNLHGLPWVLALLGLSLCAAIASFWIGLKVLDQLQGANSEGVDKALAQPR